MIKVCGSVRIALSKRLTLLFWMRSVTTLRFSFLDVSLRYPRMSSAQLNWKHMARITQTIGFSVPLAIARQVERIAKAERRSKSELFCEMVRVYERYRQQEEQFDEAWVMRLIQEA